MNNNYLCKLKEFIRRNKHLIFPFLIVGITLLFIIFSLGVPEREEMSASGGCGEDDNDVVSDTEEDSLTRDITRQQFEELFKGEDEIKDGQEGFESIKKLASRAAEICTTQENYVPLLFDRLTATYEKNRQSAVRVNMWGREYLFERGPLPATIRSQETDLFASPPSYNLSVSDSPKQLNWSLPIVTKACPGIIKMMTYAFIPIGNRASARILAYMDIEYDGMVRVVFQIYTTIPIAISNWEYKISISNEVAKYYARHWTYSWERKEVDNHIPFTHPLGPVAGIMPERLLLPFIPTVQIGNENVALEWLTETDVNWQKGLDHQLILEKNNNVTFTVKPITSVLSLTRNNPWSDEMAIFISPVRRERPWRGYRFAPAYFALSGINKVVTFNNPDPFFSIWPGLPSINDREENESQECAGQDIGCNQHQVKKWNGERCLCQYRDQTHLRQDYADRFHAIFMSYATSTVAPALHPQTVLNVDRWKANNNLWLLNQYLFPPWSAIIRKNKEFYGDGYYCNFWREALGLGEGFDCESNPNWLTGNPPTPTATYPVCGSEDYFNFLLNENLSAILDQGLEALYFDYGSYWRMCETDRRINGNQNLQSWNYFNLRKFYKNLHERLQAQRPDTLIVSHTGGFPRFLEAFADFSLYGEGMHYEFCTALGHNTRECDRSRVLYQPDYLTIPEGFLMGMFYPRIGGRAMIIPVIERATDINCDDPRNINEDQCRRAIKYQRILDGLTAINDMPLMVGNGVVSEMRRMLLAFNRAIANGTIPIHVDLDSAIFYPWWSNRNTVERNENLQVSLYVNQEGTIANVVLFNPTEIEYRANCNTNDNSCRPGVVTFDFDALNLSGVTHFYPDLEGANWHTGERLNGRNTINVTIPAKDYKIVGFVRHR